MMPSRSTPNLQQQQSSSTSSSLALSSHRDPTKTTTQAASVTTSTIYTYHHQAPILSYKSTELQQNSTTAIARDAAAGSPPPAPPVRDSSSLKSIKYGPGHEKFPSWPVPAAAEAPPALRRGPPNNVGGSHRSKSWTDHTSYPKEKVVAYTRPYMKRQHSAHTQQKLKTVMERCEKIPPETYESRFNHLYLPHVDREGKPMGDMDYMVPSPPERDIITTKPQLTKADLEEYARSYQEPLVKYTSSYDNKPSPHLTKSDLEEFMEYASSNYEDSLFSSMGSKHDDSSTTSSILGHHHQKQLSYAQSEGYHSYVSSTDSTSTPFLDRLRRDSEAVRTNHASPWEDMSEQDPHVTSNSNNGSGSGSSSGGRREGGRDSVVTTSSGSASSSETLKWHGSMSDVSVASSSLTHLASSSGSSSVSRQLIVHSARVQTPQRHHSESILYMANEHGQQPQQMVNVSNDNNSWRDKESRNNSANKLKLFPVNTYTMQDVDRHNTSTNSISSNNSSSYRISSGPVQSIADRINELEKQQKYSYLDPNKKHKVPDPTLKAIQKKALLSFYERHQQNPVNTGSSSGSTSKTNTSWRSEPQLAQQMSAVPQPPPPKVKAQQSPSRRASSASDYASGNNSKRSSLVSNRESKTTDSIASDNKPVIPKHQHSNSCGSLSTDFLGPMIVGPSISVDDWIPDKPPARPPKNPNLRTAFPDLFLNRRVPSPDLPPPSPPTVLDDEIIVNSDDPLPPPPPECDSQWHQEFNDRLKDNQSASQAQNKSESLNKSNSPINQTLGLPEQGRFISVRSSIKTRPAGQIIQQVSSKPYHGGAISIEKAKFDGKPDQVLGFPTQQTYAERSSTRYPSTQKLVLNGSVAVSQKVTNGISEQYRAEPLRLSHREESRRGIMTTEPTNESPAAKDTPPPLQPRQMRFNQSMRGRLSHDRKNGVTGDNSPLTRDDQMREARSQSMSQSKASYLASRRDRDRIVVDSEIGSYKRTMSPNGHSITPEVIPESNPPVAAKDSIWSIGRCSSKTSNNHATHLIRRPSMHEKGKKSPSHHQDKPDLEDNLKKSTSMVLPDVLPMNAKILTTRSQSQQYANRPTNLSLSPLGSDSNSKAKANSPPSSPAKTPPRGSPFSPLRSTSLSNPPPTSSTVPCVNNSRTSPHSSRSSPARTFATSGTNVSPQTPKRASPQIKPALGSPNNGGVSQQKSPLRTPSSSSSGSSTASSSPLHTSPLSSPSYSPKLSSPPNLSPPQSPKTEEYPKVVEGLQLIQRTEVVLRVNTSTTDASSQTEKDELPPTPLPTRKKLQEEIECEKLSEDFVNHLPIPDRLKDILLPGPDYKKPTDYVYGLFKVDVTSRPRPANSPFRSRTNTPSCSPPPTSTPTNVTNAVSSSSSSSKISNSPASPMSALLEPASPLSGSSTYFTISEPKAKFLTRYSQDMSQQHIVKDTKDLSQKKEELVNRLDRKLEVLRSEQLVVSEECKINNELGDNVEAHIRRLARPHEADKFRLHIEEVGKITSLLLGLSGRLARAENALMGMPEDHPERRILESKRDKLLEQLEEAKKLKECIDRRSISVSNILYKYLNSEEYTDYDHFINMKAKLIMDSKEIAEKIKLGEEQLVALKQTLIVTAGNTTAD